MCFLGIFSLALYAVIWQPLQWSGRPGAKLSKVPVQQGDVFDTLASILGELEISFRVLLTVPVGARADKGLLELQTCACRAH